MYQIRIFVEEHFVDSLNIYDKNSSDTNIRPTLDMGINMYEYYPRHRPSQYRMLQKLAVLEDPVARLSLAY
jgi:hypothetical protein